MASTQTSHEKLDESGATEDAAVDPRFEEGVTGTSADTSLDPLGGFAVELPPKVRDFITDRPVAATLASAAVGAGLVAMLLLATRDNSGWKAAVASKADTVTDSFSTLRDQVADLASKLAASLPSRDAAADALAAARNQTQNQAQDTAATLRGQAQDLLDKLRPYVGATTDMARAYPLWTSVAVGVLGALLGSQMLGASPAEKVDAQSS
jgi:ElaB/YqjD/DUF883 family membrane-anchored ribosome-binding protein